MNLKIERLDHYGRGIGYINNKITFINNALINEIVTIKEIKEYKKYNIANVDEIISKSNNRINPICPYYHDCGGCDIMHMDYDTQLKFKEEKFKNILKKYANIEENKINSIIPSKELNYRNKITLHVKNKKIGLYKNNSNDIVEIDKCFITDEDINKVIKSLEKFILDTENSIDKIIIKKANNILLYIKGKIETNKLINYFDDINIVVNDKCILNNDYIIDKIFNKKFKVSSESFYQVNSKQIENLYSLVIKNIKNMDYNKALDLYCGTGTIGIIISDYVKEVIGIEVSKSSYRDALENKKINNINNIKFINGKVEDYIDDFKNVDVVIVDPPRSGLDKHTIKVLESINSQKIIYVSCDPITLARDIKLLSSNYKTIEITPVDMFPNTHHVECISVLERKSVEK